MSGEPRSLRERAAQAERLARDIGNAAVREDLEKLAAELNEQADREERDPETPGA